MYSHWYVATVHIGLSPHDFPGLELRHHQYVLLFENIVRFVSCLVLWLQIYGEFLCKQTESRFFSDEKMKFMRVERLWAARRQVAFRKISLVRGLSVHAENMMAASIKAVLFKNLCISRFG